MFRNFCTSETFLDDRQGKRVSIIFFDFLSLISLDNSL